MSTTHVTYQSVLKRNLKLDLTKPIHFYISGCAQPAYLVKKGKIYNPSSVFLSILCNILSVCLIYVVDGQNCLPAHEDSHKHTSIVKCYVPVCIL